MTIDNINFEDNLRKKDDLNNEDNFCDITQSYKDNR